jgi:lipase chaperone LimK
MDKMPKQVQTSDQVPELDNLCSDLEELVAGVERIVAELKEIRADNAQSLSADAANRIVDLCEQLAMYDGRFSDPFAERAEQAFLRPPRT